MKLSAAAFDDLLGALQEARDQYVLGRFDDTLDTLEGFRYLLQLVSETSELLVEGDPERPRFSLIVSPARKFLGDNPDSIYHQTVIRGDRSYRIKGRRTGQDYISFTVHGPEANGGFAGPVLGDINDQGFDVAADGTFELILSPTKPAGAKNWLELHPDACIVLVRNYFQRPVSVQTDPFVHVELAIEPIDEPGPPPPLDDTTLADRLRAAAGVIRATTTGIRVFGEPSPVAFVADEPNNVGPPQCFRQAGVDAAGAVDIYYSSGNFKLGPDEALVMTGRIPPGVFTNVMLWNVHMQTLEYVGRRSSLNASQIIPEADGSYRIVIAHRDPGVPNWLDTGGHNQGTIFWRFLLPDEQPEHPQCTVVPVDSLA